MCMYTTHTFSLLHTHTHTSLSYVSNHQIAPRGVWTPGWGVRHLRHPGFKPMQVWHQTGPWWLMVGNINIYTTEACGMITACVTRREFYSHFASFLNHVCVLCFYSYAHTHQLKLDTYLSSSQLLYPGFKSMQVWPWAGPCWLTVSDANHFINPVYYNLILDQKEKLLSTVDITICSIHLYSYQSIVTSYVKDRFVTMKFSWQLVSCNSIFSGPVCSVFLDNRL